MTEARDRLADEMNRRRVQLRLRWREVAERAGVDASTLRRVRADQLALTDFVSEGIELALEWERDSVKAILDGGEPTPREEVRRLLLDKVEEELWAIETLPEDMRWEVIKARRAGKAHRSGNDDDGGHRRHGT